MMDQAAWDALRVIRFDRDAESAPLPNPTPLAPWRTWLDGNYRPCRTAEQFRSELVRAPGAVIVLLHRTDLDSRLQSGELDAWLDGDPAGDTGRPQRLILVYACGWGHRDYTAVVAPRLAARHAPRRWYTFSSEHLARDARPAAWLGHAWNLGLSLERVAQPFNDWRQDAARQLMSGIEFTLGSLEQLFLQRMREDVLRHQLLRHILNSEGSRSSRGHAERRQALLDEGDRLWLLQGVAASLGWSRSAALLQCVLTALTRLLRSGIDLDDKERPDNRAAWQDTIQEIDRLIRETGDE